MDNMINIFYRRPRQNDFLKSRFISGFFSYMTAASRNLSENECKRDTFFEESLVLFSRLVYYVGDSNKKARLYHELCFIEYYLYLQSFRFQNKLSYQVSMDIKLSDFTIPKLLMFNRLEQIIGDTTELSDNPFFISIEAICQTKRRKIIRVTIRSIKHNELLQIWNIKISGHKSYKKTFSDYIFPMQSKLNKRIKLINV